VGKISQFVFSVDFVVKVLGIYEWFGWILDPTVALPVRGAIQKMEQLNGFGSLFRKEIELSFFETTDLYRWMRMGWRVLFR